MIDDVMTPQEFLDRMKVIASDDYPESSHILADELMIKLLKQLGYQDGAEVFISMEKWYS